MSTPWLRCRLRRPNATGRVVCFPHAGGAASFFGAWGREISDNLELSAVQYPGREDRLTDPCADELGELVADVADALGSLADKPLILFGHSFGALVAYEVARVLEHQHGVSAAQLVLSGRRSAAIPATGDVHRRADDDVVDELVRLGGTSGELLRDITFRSVFLPAIRADFRLTETYEYAPDPVLSCPITAVIGAEDTEVDAVQARAWAACTTGPFAFHSLPGGHFYLVPHRAAVLDLLAGALAPAV